MVNDFNRLYLLAYQQSGQSLRQFMGWKVMCKRSVEAWNIELCGFTDTGCAASLYVGVG